MKMLTLLALVAATSCASGMFLGGRPSLGGLVGGIESNKNSLGSKMAIQRTLDEVKNRIVGYGVGETVLVSEVVDVKTQMVAGTKYYITLKLGLTDEADCEAVSENGFVGAADCPGTDLGLYKVEVVYQPWMEEKYVFSNFEDVEGPGLKTLWTASDL